MTEAQAKETLSQQSDAGVAAINFTRVDVYTTFTAEHAIKGDDLVFHFFLTEEMNDVPTYWDKVFPSVLDAAAQAFFKATFPRLKAAFTREINSWWLKAANFGNVGDPETRALAFYATLDAALDAEISKTVRR